MENEKISQEKCQEIAIGVVEYMEAHERSFTLDEIVKYVGAKFPTYDTELLKTICGNTMLLFGKYGIVVPVDETHFRTLTKSEMKEANKRAMAMQEEALQAAHEQSEENAATKSFTKE